MLEPPYGIGPMPSGRLVLADRFPPYLVLLRVGFTMPRPLLAERCAFTAPFHPYHCGNGHQGEPFGSFRRPLRREGSRGGIFSVALAVCGI